VNGDEQEIEEEEEALVVVESPALGERRKTTKAGKEGRKEKDIGLVLRKQRNNEVRNSQIELFEESEE
jgi:hypothetical protein